eukprot:Opistho-2@39570
MRHSASARISPGGRRPHRRVYSNMPFDRQQSRAGHRRVYSNMPFDRQQSRAGHRRVYSNMPSDRQLSQAAGSLSEFPGKNTPQCRVTVRWMASVTEPTHTATPCQS